MAGAARPTFIIYAKGHCAGPATSLDPYTLLHLFVPESYSIGLIVSVSAHIEMSLGIFIASDLYFWALSLSGAQEIFVLMGRWLLLA